MDNDKTVTHKRFGSINPIDINQLQNRGHLMNASGPRQDTKAHADGYAAGQQRKPLEANPYPPASAEGWSWASGYIEGKANPDKPYPTSPKAMAHG